jgi:hypothetical protein
MQEAIDSALDSQAADAALLRVYRQVFAVLAREAGAMVLDAASVAVDEAILDAFADAGSQGMTLAQVQEACFETATRLFADESAAGVVRRVEERMRILREYGALNRVVDRPNELYYRAAFAPYVMVLFLRRIASQGGQSELHQLLTLEQLSVTSERANEQDGRAALARLTKVFRLLANELAILAARGSAETLRENVQLLWGNEVLITQGEVVHAKVLEQWPRLDHECRGLRLALAAYGDAVQAASSRLVVQAGTTRALGLLPVEAWRSFADGSNAGQLAAVLDGFLVDAPAPWFSPQQLIDAVESGRIVTPIRKAPPRPEHDPGLPDEVQVHDEAPRLLELAAELLGADSSVPVTRLVDREPDWPAARRLLSELTAIHQHPDVPFELAWSDGLRVRTDAAVSFVSDGVLRPAVGKASA